MKKENREMLKLIISNQELIMKALNVQMPVAKVEKAKQPKPEEKKLPTKKSSVKKPVKKVSKKK